MKVFNNEHKKSNAKLLYDLMKIIIAVLLLAPIARHEHELVFILTGSVLCALSWVAAYLFERSIK